MLTLNLSLSPHASLSLSLSLCVCVCVCGVCGVCVCVCGVCDRCLFSLEFLLSSLLGVLWEAQCGSVSVKCTVQCVVQV